MSAPHRKPIRETGKPAPGRTRAEFAEPCRSGAPMSRLDLILASPLLAALRPNLGASPPGPRGQKPARAPTRVQAMYAMLCRDIASLFAPEPAQSGEELKTILMFSLGGLALSFHLAAQAKAAGLDEVLAGILLLSS
jgi:hypothetical protein